MKEKYQLTLAPNRLKRNKVLAIHIMAAILLVVIGFITVVTPFSIDIFMAGKGVGYQPFTWINAVGFVFIAIGIGVLIVSIFKGRWLQGRKNNSLIRILELTSFLAIGLYGLLHGWYLPAAYGGGTVLAILLVWFFENKATVKTTIKINEQGVFSNDSMWEPWQNISTLVVKFNVLSIRITSGKMIQMMLNVVPQDAEAITDYAKHMIPKQKSVPLEEEW